MIHLFMSEITNYLYILTPDGEVSFYRDLGKKHGWYVSNMYNKDSISKSLAMTYIGSL